MRPRKPLTPKGLVEALGLKNVKELNEKLAPHQDEIGELIGGYYYPKQMNIIYHYLGEPKNGLRKFNVNLD